MKRIATPLLLSLVLTMPTAIAQAGDGDALGMGIFVRDGQASSLALVGDGPFYIDELDMVATVTTTTDEGIAPVRRGGDLAGLDWSGVERVEEDWRPDGQGTFTRQRFYRHARWMERGSTFVIWQADDSEILPRFPFVVRAGSEHPRSGDGFIRRFVARQIASGCAAIDDCTTATSYTAQALVQYRHARQPDHRSRSLHPRATRLLVQWTEEAGRTREVPIEQVARQDAPFAHGLHPEIEALSTPANGTFYQPGESVTFAIRFRDDQGNVLAGDGDMPTYADFLFGQTSTGLRYFDLGVQTTLFYALKHRESNMILAMAGPAHKLRDARGTVDTSQFFSPFQAHTAFPGVDGWTGLAYLIPNFGVLFGGLSDPAIWDSPVPDVYTFTIPLYAEPGTYVVALKARRDYGGQPINRGAVARVQVGQVAPTTWAPTTGRCANCHRGESSVTEILHGVGDRESCFGCHVALDVEPDAGLSYRVHFIHSRSQRFPGTASRCGTCHLEEPEGDPIGFPGFVYPF